MSNPTTPFGWQMPTNTDLVTNLPADFEVFGQAVASSMADLLGGTTGQILSKATNADMDFTWISANPGDITGITANSPLTGGGTSGDVTVGIQAASTTQSGAVQLTDSTSSTSTTTAATPNSVKTTYDLATGAIPKSTVTTSGDVIYATGSGAVTRLGIGSTGQVLTVAGGVPSWATAAGGGGMTSIASGTFSTSTSVQTINSISGSYKDLFLIIRGFKPTSGQESRPFIRFNNVSTNNYSNQIQTNYSGTAQFQTGTSAIQIFDTMQNFQSISNNDASYVGIYVQDYANTSTNKSVETSLIYFDQANNWRWGTIDSRFETTSAISRIDITTNNATNFGGGSYVLFGVN